jgi:hypothetical protein
MANNHEKKQDRAHFTSSAEGLSPITLHALKEFKAKLMSATKGPHEAFSSGLHARIVCPGPHLFI